MRTLLAISVLWAAAVPFLLCTLASAGERPKKITTVEGITEYQLENGLRLLLYPDSSRPKATVNMTVLVGSRHEGYGETGMAHLLEHLLFKGTPTHPDIPKVLREHGAQFNGTTSSDRTNYFETFPASDENLEFFIRMEADRLVKSYVRKEDLDSEMTVVRNEFERGENSPTGVLMKRIAAAAYSWHNYGKPTIGNRSDIERVPIENLRAFYRKYYQPDNVVLVVAGQFEEAKTLALVQTYFGAIPRPQREHSTTYTEEPEQDGERLVTLRRVGDVGAVGVAYHIPAGPHEDWAALQVLSTILSSEPSGRLYKALVETKKATRVYASARGQHDPGLLMTQAEVRDPKELDEVRDIMHHHGRRHRHARRDRRGSEPRSTADPQGPRAGCGRHQSDCDCAQRMGRPGRLALVLPAPRSPRAGHPQPGAGRGRTLSTEQQPHRGPVHPN